MTRFIPDEIIEQIRDRSDIVDVINGYVPLKKAGASWKGLCPFHQEKTPSFVVNPGRHSFHCFGCGKGGDVFRFVMDKENVDFPTAAHMLARRCDVLIPETSGTAGGDPEERKRRTDQRERLFDVHEEICAWYQRVLADGGPVSDYLKTRRLPADVVEKFRLGASPDAWSGALDYLRGRGRSDEDLLRAGLIKASDKSPGKLYDTFRNRLMFPIWNEQGKVVAFSARSIEKDPQGWKYVNSPETPIFSKSRVLYALPLARVGMREKGFAILCEGQLDVIAMHRAGFDNAVAPQGTAFTEEQGRILKRYADRLFLAFDSDSAGRKAVRRAMDILLPFGFEVRVITFPEGRDPDDIFEKEGPEGLSKLVDAADDFFDFALRDSLSGTDQTSSWEIDRVVGEVLDHVTKIQSPVVRSTYAAKLAQALKLPENAVYAELNNRLNKSSAKADFGESRRVARIPVVKNRTVSAVDRLGGKAELTLLELALAHGTVGKRLSVELPPGMISDGPVGCALDKVIKMTLDGDWERASTALLDDVRDEPVPEITRVLAQPHEFDHEHQEKAVDDCLRTIKSVHLRREVDELIERLKTIQDPAERNEVRRRYMEKRGELDAINKIGQKPPEVERIDSEDDSGPEAS